MNSPESGPLRLAGQVRRGLAWSAVSTITLRLGTFVLGIVLARILAPDQFGAYAVALTVQGVLLTLADLGLSTDLVRSVNPDERAPTVATFGLVSGGVLAGSMALTSTMIAEAFGTPEAAPAVKVLSITLLLAGAGVVPYAMLLRRLAQKTLFGIAAVDFVVSTVLTLSLLAEGWGVMALVVSRVVTQALVLVLQFRYAHVRPRYGLDRRLWRSVLAFGAPVALANLLSWAVINVDNLIVARVLGTTALGFYALGFNVANWPMTAIGQVVRSVALPALARAGQSRGVFVQAVALTWALALPAGMMLAVLASPLIHVVYGAQWSTAAVALAALGVFGSLRVIFDLFAAFLYARGLSASVLHLQVLWVVAVIPAVYIGARSFGIVGAAWAHVVVSIVVVAPAYLWVLHRGGADVGALRRFAWQPVVATGAATAAAVAVLAWATSPVLQLVGGAAAGGATYICLLFRWGLDRLSALRGHAAAGEAASEGSVERVSEESVERVSGGPGGAPS